MLMVCAACRRQNSGENTCAWLVTSQILLRTSQRSIKMLRHSCLLKVWPACF